MIFDYSLAAVVAAGLLCYSTHGCDLSDFSTERVCPWIQFPSRRPAWSQRALS
jgi:hypothetical protein